MSKEKLKVKTIVHKMKCWVCEGSGYVFNEKSIKTTKDSVSIKSKKCKVCKGTGIYKEKNYIMTYKGMGFQVDNIN